MRYTKLSHQLVIYFASTLFIYTVIISLVFNYLTISNTKDILTKNVTKYSQQLVIALEHVRQDTSKQKSQGFNSYLKIIPEFIDGDIWVVDEDNNITQFNHLTSENYYVYDEISDLITLVKNDNQQHTATAVLDNTENLVMATPFTNNNNNYILIVTNPLTNLSEMSTNTMYLLAISYIIAFLLAMLTSIKLAKSFTKPVIALSQATNELIKQNYDIEIVSKRNDEIKVLSDNLNSLKISLARSHEADLILKQQQEDFLASVSHEIKTPVTIIKSYLDGINDGIISSNEYDETFNILTKNTSYLEFLINDLLLFAKLEHTDYQLTFTNEKLSSIINDIIKDLKPLADRKGVNFINLINEDKVLSVDKNRFKQIILILLTNSLEYANSAITITLNDSLIISDDGPGFSKDDLENMFTKFYSNKIEGSGLGLNIAQLLINKHQFQIIAYNNNGATYEISFIKKSV